MSGAADTPFPAAHASVHPFVAPTLQASSSYNDLQYAFFESPPPHTSAATKQRRSTVSLPFDPSVYLLPAPRRSGFLSEWELLKPLGEARGSVRLWKAQARHGDHATIAAVKIVRKQLLRNCSAGAALAREIELHTAVTGAPNVVPLLEVWEELVVPVCGEEEGGSVVEESGGGSTRSSSSASASGGGGGGNPNPRGGGCGGGSFVALVLPLHTHGDLASYLRARIVPRALPNEARLILRQLLTAAAALFERGIIHFDIKPDNVLVVSTVADSQSPSAQVETIALCDFGAARRIGGILDQEKDEFDDGICGTLGFVAPEVFRRQQVGHAADVWAIGCLFYELYAGYPPFIPYRLPLEATWPLPWLQTGSTATASGGEGNGGIDWLAKDLACLMLETDPAKRITANDALNHAFFLEEKPVVQGYFS